MEHGGRKTVIKEIYIRNGSSCVAARLESAKKRAHAARRTQSPPLYPAAHSRKQVKKGSKQAKYN